MKEKNLIIILIFLILVFFISCDNENTIVDNGHITDSIKEDTIHKDTIYQDTIKSKIYNFCLADVPVSAKSYDHIFIGSALYHKANGLYSINAPENMRYEEIEYGTFYNQELYFTKGTPSLSETNKLFKEIASAPISQNGTFIYSSPVTFHNHRELYLWGMKNRGIELDSIFSGRTYKWQKMLHKNGLIYTFYNELATIAMDYPEKSLLKNILTPQEKDSLVYVNSITYGKLCYMIAEFDISNDTAKEIIIKLLKGEKLSQDEVKIISQVNVCVVSFNEKAEPIIINGHESLISNFYSNSQKLSFTPLTFSVLSLTDNSESSISYTVDMK
jgi:hypothetical protein